MTILTKISSLENNWLITIVIAVMTYFLAKIWFMIKIYPPGPIPLPIIGNLLSFRTKDHAFAVIDRFRQKYGDIFTLWLGSEPVVIISDWNLMNEALIKKSKNFSGRPQQNFGEILAGGHDDLAFTDYGPKWEVMRKIAATALRKYAVTDHFRDSVCSTIDEMIQNMLNSQQPVNPKEYVFHAILNITAEGAFGQKYKKDDREYAEMRLSVEMVMNEFSRGLPSDMFPFLRPLFRLSEERLRSQMARCRKVLFEKYADHLNSYQPGKIRDFTDAVIAARKEAEIEGNTFYSELTDDNFLNIVNDLFLAGTHTTVLAVLWLFVLIGNHTDVQKKIVTEIDEIIGDRMPCQEDKAKCHYTSAVIMESLRYKSISPFGLQHKASCDSVLGGQPIKAGTAIIFNLRGQHMDPKNWSDPTEFKPERFLEKDAISKVRKEGYVPFGAGRRICAGEKLAISELFLVIVRVLQQCRITLPNGPGSGDFGHAANQIFFCPPKPFEICMQQRKDCII